MQISLKGQGKAYNPLAKPLSNMFIPKETLQLSKVLGGTDFLASVQNL